MASQGLPAADVRGAQAMDLDDVEPPLRPPSPEEAQKLGDLEALTQRSEFDQLRLVLSNRCSDSLRGVFEFALSNSLDEVLKEATRHPQPFPAWLQRLCLDDKGNPRKRKEPKELFDLFKDWTPPAEDPRSHRTCARLMLYLLNNGIEREGPILGEFDQASLTTLSDAFLMYPVQGSLHLAFLEKIAACYEPTFFAAGKSSSDSKIDSSSKSKSDSSSKSKSEPKSKGKGKSKSKGDSSSKSKSEPKSKSKDDSSSESQSEPKSKSKDDSSSESQSEPKSKSKDDSSSESQSGFNNYGPIVHVVQSSGTGKSRLVNEVCTMLPGISICFRQLGATAQQGFPLGDDAMTRFCLNQTGGNHKKQAAAIALLAALLEKLAQEPSEADEAYFWREWGLKHVEDPNIPDKKRSSFFEKVVERANSLLRKHADQVAKGAGRKQLSEFASKLCKSWCVSAANALAKRIEMAKNLVGASSLDQLDEPAREKAKKDAASLEQLDELAREYYRSKAVLFLGLDEATFLDEPPSEGIAPRHGIHLIHFRRALFELSKLDLKLRIWTILVDTFAGVDTIIDPVMPSSRAVSHPPLPPFVSLPFDVFAGEESSPPREASGFLTYARLRKIGRPLWGTLEVPDDDVVSYAARKLFQSQTFDPNDNDHVVAAFSRRLWLELNLPQEYVSPSVEAEDQDRPSPQSLYDLSVRAVRSHLRIVDNLDAPSRTISTKNGSEPIVSIAAYQALMHRNCYAAALLTLVGRLNTTCKLLNRGDLGELLMRLVLTLARDFAYAKIDKSHVAKRKELVALPTVNFLQELLGEDDYGLSDPKEAEELERRVANTYVSFTHFAAAPRYDKEISARDLLSYWTRTVALQCEHNQMGVDAIIPIYRGDPNDPFNPKSLSYIGFQVKLRQSSTQPTWSVKLSPNGTFGRDKKGKKAADAATIKSVKCNVWGPAIVGGTIDRERPLVIVMDLGVTRDSTPSNRLYTDMRISTSNADSKAFKDRDAKGVSMDEQRAELKELAQQWLLDHHGKSTTDFAALHVPSLTDTYEGLFRQALGDDTKSFLTKLDPLIAQNLRQKDLTDKEIEFKASQDPSNSKHIQCVPRC